MVDDAIDIAEFIERPVTQPKSWSTTWPMWTFLMSLINVLLSPSLKFWS